MRLMQNKCAGLAEAAAADKLLLLYCQDCPDGSSDMTEFVQLQERFLLACWGGNSPALTVFRLP